MTKWKNAVREFYSLSAKNRISRGARNPDKLPGSSIGSFIQ